MEYKNVTAIMKDTKTVYAPFSHRVETREDMSKTGKKRGIVWYARKRLNCNFALQVAYLLS